MVDQIFSHAERLLLSTDLQAGLGITGLTHQPDLIDDDFKLISVLQSKADGGFEDGVFPNFLKRLKNAFKEVHDYWLVIWIPSRSPVAYPSLYPKV